MKRYAGLVDPSGPNNSEWYQMIKIGRYLLEQGYALESAIQGTNPFLEGSTTEPKVKSYLPAKDWALELASKACEPEQPLEKMVSSEIEKVLSYVLSVLNEDKETVDFLVYWADQVDRHPLRYAVKVAKIYDVPSFNLRDAEDKARFASMLSELKG